MFNQIVSQSFRRYDSDAWTWIQAVETADAQVLETGVRLAMNALVVDLKSNSLWTPIRSMTVKMGARTLAGALIDVKTPAQSWINFGGNFVSGDYNRTTGLKGNGTTKRLDTRILNNADGQNNQSMFLWVTTLSTIAGSYLMGAGDNNFGGNTGATYLRRNSSTSSTLDCSSRNSTGQTDTSAHATGFIGISRASSTEYTSRGGGASQTNSSTSQSPAMPAASGKIAEWTSLEVTTGDPVPGTLSDHRSCIAGTGAALDLATLETVLQTFITRITALSL